MTSRGETGGDATDDAGVDAHGAKPRGADREFGWRGWLLVAWLFISLLVVPSVLFYLPRAGAFTASLGLGYRDAFLVLPLLPALGLGLLAVWATTRP
ncbi:hypothetical protein [Halosegnis sp.]|uniref:hypothetical protein n=1 Tax=Halosegnis sp. TaxID=2864959 RepID=UPI0035D4F1DF